MNLKPGLSQYSKVIKKRQMKYICKFNPKSDEFIVFLHGLACSWDSFTNVFDYNYLNDKSILIPAILGFGKSSKPIDFSYTMEAHAELIEELLLSVCKGKIHIVGHSMGGAIGLLFSDKIFSKTLSFTNVEGNLIKEDCGLLSRGIASITLDEYRKNLYKSQLIEYKDHIQLRFRESVPEALYYSAVSLVQWSDSGKLLDKFKSLNCRKSYFYGEYNKTAPALKKLDFVQKCMINNSGHAMSSENPSEFYSHLEIFINSE